MRRSSPLLAVLVVALLAVSAIGPAEAATPATGRVAGVVRHELGAVVPQATVRLSPAVTVPDGGTFEPAAPVATVITDAGGRYEADVPAGTYDLVVTGGAGGAPYTAAIRGLTVAGGAGAPTDIVVVRPWVTFSGRVVDGNGAPIESELSLDQPPTYDQYKAARTAADGSFSLSMPAGVYHLWVRGKLPNLAGVSADVPALDLTADRHLTLTFPPLADVDVTVRTPAGLQAGQAYLGCFDSCRPAAGDLFPGANAHITFHSDGKPDSTGRVRLPGFSATGARIIVSDFRDVLRDVRKEGLTITAPGSLTVDQPAVGPTVTFQGVLKDTAGQPLEDGHVTLTDKDGYSVADEIYHGQDAPPGTFTLAVPPGRYQLEVSANLETVWDQQGVESGIYVEGLFVTLEDFEITADRTQDLTVPVVDFPVTVLDAEGRPAPWIDVDGVSGETDDPSQGDAVIELFPGGTGRGRLVNTDGSTDQQGVKVLKVFAGAAPPKVTVTTALASATKKVARTATSAEVRLPATNQIGGRLRDSGGALPGMVRMDIDSATGSGFDVESFRDDGQWAFTAPAGRYSIRFGYPYHEYDDEFEHAPTASRPAFWWIDTELDVSKAADLDVTLPAAGRADVFVHDTDGSLTEHELSSEATGTGGGVTLAPGLKGRGTARSDAVDVIGAGHLRAPLFGPSNVALRVGSPRANPFTQAHFPLSPGGSVHVALAVRGAAPAPTPNGPSGEIPTPPGAPAPPAAPPAGPHSFPDQSGYWALGADGKVYAFGDAPRLGDWTGLGPTEAIDVEPSPSGRGYWILDDRGRVKAFGDATPLGDLDAGRLRGGERAASLSATPTGLGYWVFTNRGRVFTFGDAANFGDVGDVKLDGPVLDSVATPSGRGYFMVASDGGIFTFGDARFVGSMGGTRLNAPVQSLVPDGDGAGYWLVASDGGIFAFDAPFRGSLGSTRLNKPIRGMVRYGNGYLMVGEDGGIFNFSDRPFSGSLGGQPPSRPVVGVAALP